MSWRPTKVCTYLKGRPKNYSTCQTVFIYFSLPPLDKCPPSPGQLPSEYFDSKTPHTTSFWNIIIQRTSHDDLTENLVSLVSSAKLVKLQKCKTALCDLTEKPLVSNFIERPNPQIIPEAKSIDESS